MEASVRLLNSLTLI